MSGYDVSAPTHTDHGKVINGLKGEIKNSLATSDKEKIIKDKLFLNTKVLVFVKFIIIGIR